MEMNPDILRSPSSKSISVAMASYNGGSFLRQQINSILSQTLPPSDIFVSDDRSEDSTLSILIAESSDHRLRYCVNKERLGVIANFKNAISLCADSDFTALSDQDDVWMIHKLEILAGELSQIETDNTPAMVYSDLSLTDAAGNVINPSFWNELGHDWYTHCLPTLLFGNFVTGCTILMNRKMREAFTIMPSDILMHDAWLALIAFSFGKAGRVMEPLVLYRRHENNVSAVGEYRKKTRVDKWIEHARQLIKNDFLTEQFALLKKFISFYEDRLSDDHKKIIQDFLRLEHTSYLTKKRYMRSVFKKYGL